MDAAEAAEVVELGIRSMLASLEVRLRAEIADRAPPPARTASAAPPRRAGRDANRQIDNGNP